MPEVRPIDATDEVLLVGAYKEFLPESKGRAGGALGVAVTPEATSRFLTGGGAQKVVGLVSPEDGAESRASNPNRNDKWNLRSPP